MQMEDAGFGRVARGVLDSLLEGCQVIGFDWRYLYVNDAVARQGQKTREELLGRTMSECYPGIDATPMFSVLERCMAERTHARMDNEFTQPDGTTGWFSLRFVPVPEGVCILSLDITEERRSREVLRRVEDQLGQAQKMEAVGRLAGGVAHDFNNLLSVILSYGETLLAGLDPGEPRRADLEEITSAAKRAADLTRQLLTFSRMQVLNPTVVDLNEVLARMDRMLQRVLGADVDFVCLPDPQLGKVLIDVGNLERAIMNLVLNARDAMPTGGKVTLETGTIVLDEAYAREHLGVLPGPHAMLAVSDTGCGMDKPTLARLFEPFFTTKPVGKGTGLGLSTVFGIVKQSGGTIWVYSEPGKGTTFKLYFPLAGPEARQAIAEVKPSDTRGTETILLVEDEPQVRAVAASILRKQGYHVIEARNAGEALLHAEKYPKRIHLLLSDVVMPQMSGPELALRLGRARSDMKVLCMSGYTDDSIVRHGVIEADLAYLQKPITPDSLARKVREVLDGPQVT